MFDKDVTTLLLQIGTSSGGFEHPVLKCSSLPRNVLEGGLIPLALPPRHKDIFSREIFLQFVKEMQIFVIGKTAMLREIGVNWNYLKHAEVTQIPPKKWNNTLMKICATGGLPF